MVETEKKIGLARNIENTEKGRINRILPLQPGKATSFPQQSRKLHRFHYIHVAITILKARL